MIEESGPFSVSDSSTLDVRVKEKNIHDAEGKTSALAWVALIALWMLASSSSLMWLSFSVVSDISRQWLSVDLSAVNWIANATALMYVFMSIVTGWFFERFGLKSSVGVTPF
ncbi:hypothetical protein VKS41_002411 [Umbelopsis sp. WA50703]|jgi:MFS family permease